MTFMSVVFMFPTTPITDAPDMNYTCEFVQRSTWIGLKLELAAVVCGIMTLSIVWYYFPKYGGVHWFKGPISTVENVPEKARNSQSSDSKKDSEDLM
jgi:hypothetical protein